MYDKNANRSESKFTRSHRTIKSLYLINYKTKKMQRLMLLGNLGGDAVLRTVGDKSAINFSVAHTNKFKNKEGVVEERTTWWDCTIWRNAGQSTEIAKYLKRGVKVLCEGEPSAETYTDKNGTATVSMKCFVKSIELLSSLPKQENQPAESSSATAASNSHGQGQGEFSDDLPF